jgi:transcription antitermination factor NusG
LPCKKIKRQWSDRIKTFEEPFFKSHVFVKVASGQRTEVRITEGVINFAYKDGKPVQIKEREIKTLKTLLSGEEHAEIKNTDCLAGQNQNVN